MDLCYNGVCNDNIKSGVIPCATTNILYYLNGKSVNANIKVGHLGPKRS